MAGENVKVCGGILLMRSESGTSKIEKVLVETKPGKTKGRVKCRLQKFVKDTLRPSRIPVLIKNRKTKKSVHSSIISNNCLDKDKDPFIDPSSIGDWKVDKRSEDVPRQKILQMEGPDSKTTTASEEIRSEMLEEEESVPILNMADSAVDLLYQSGNKDSAIHTDFPEDDDFEDDDDDEYASLTKFQDYNIKRSPTIVMAQYSSTMHKPNEATERSESESNEEFEIIERSVDSSDVDTERRYIDSGLRRLKSQESRLFLDEFVYKTKRKPPAEGEDDGVAPLLEELPSDIFQPPKASKRPSSKSIKSPPPLSKGDLSYESQDDESKTPSEASDIDTGPLDRLKELEDKSYVISPADLVDDGQTSRHSGLSRLAVRDGSLEDKDLSRPSSLIRAGDKDTSRFSGFGTPTPLPVRIRSRSLSRHSDHSWRDTSFPLIDSVGPSIESLDIVGGPRATSSIFGGPLIESVGPSTESLIQAIGRPSGTVPAIGKLSKLVETPSKEELDSSGKLHTKDDPGGKPHGFSSTSFKPQRHRKPYNKDVEFCFHTRDPPQSPRYSSDSLHQLRRSQYSRSSSRDRSSIRIVRPSKSQGFSTISLIDNKEARRSRFSKTKKSSKNW